MKPDNTPAILDTAGSILDALLEGIGQGAIAKKRETIIAVWAGPNATSPQTIPVDCVLVSILPVPDATRCWFAKADVAGVVNGLNWNVYTAFIPSGVGGQATYCRIPLKSGDKLYFHQTSAPGSLVMTFEV